MVQYAITMNGGITHFKFHLSRSNPHSNTKKCPNVPPEVKQEIRQLSDQKNKEKAKKAADIKEIRAELRGTMGGRDRHLIDNDEDEEEEENVYMYSGDMTLDERAEFRTTCRASKASEWNRNKKKDLQETKDKWVNL